jgi:hypothetical protein
MEPEATERVDGGDPACWAHLICPDCGAVETDGYRAGCRFERPGSPDGAPIERVGGHLVGTVQLGEMLASDQAAFPAGVSPPDARPGSVHET